MDILDIQIAMDDLGQQLLKAGKGPDWIREFLCEEAERVAAEIEAEEVA